MSLSQHRPKKCSHKAESGDVISVHYKVIRYSTLVQSEDSWACLLIAGMQWRWTPCCKVVGWIGQGELTDGTEFDNSFERGEPISFKLGSGMVIPGWEQGLLGACKGEKRKLKIPPHLGYGESGAGDTIPGNWPIAEMLGRRKIL